MHASHCFGAVLNVDVRRSSREVVMKSVEHGSLFGILLLCWVVALSSFGCGGGNQTQQQPPPPISVSFSLAPQTVNTNLTAQFTATVSNDPSNKGVTWTVSCSASPCGTVSPTSTASGTATTYTPPAFVANSLSVNVTAASASDKTKSQTVPITVYPPIAVSVSPTTDAIPTGATATFSATLTNDGANKGVTWTATCNATSCGSFSPASSLSGNTTTYTAPSNPPVGVLSVNITATSVTDTSKTGSASVTTSSIAVAITPNGASVESGGTQRFTATVSNDPSNSGVSWSLLKTVCNPFNHQCGHVPCTNCGTLSSDTTASGAPVTYTAPAEPVFAPILQATSVAYASASSHAPITILYISVAVSPSSSSVTLKAAQQITGTVTNDGTNSGVTWILTQNGAACSPTCGTISPTSTASGAATTYTAPATVPALAALTLTATSAEDTRQSASATITVTNMSGAACGVGSGSESSLKGQYAFLAQGFFQGSGPDAFIGLGGTRGVVAITGSFTADGTGKITGGEEDINTPSTEQTLVTIDSARSSYSVGSDHRGCMALAVSGGGTAYFRFALGALNSNLIATAGRVIEFDDTTGTGMRAGGAIRLQDPTSFTASQFKGTYAIGLVGADAGNGRLAIAGTFASDGNSTISSATFDIDDAGTVTSESSATPGGSFTCCDANGRGTLTLQIGNNTGAFLPSLAFYMIGASDSFLVNSTAPPCAPGCNSQYGGEAISIPSGTAFSQASLDGVAVLRETGQSSSGAIVDIATVSADGKNVMTVNNNINSAGTFSASSTVLNFTVASNGRVAFTGGSTPPVIYLYGPNQGFLIGTDPEVTLGILEPQAAGPFSNASFSGAYILGTENPSAEAVTTESGVLTADGNGNAAGTLDQSSPHGLTQNQVFDLTDSFPANGSGNVGTGTTAILISGKKLVFINNTDPNPTITVVEK